MEEELQEPENQNYYKDDLDEWEYYCQEAEYQLWGL